MSTKSTILYGPDFHFYTEAFEEECIYLDLPASSVEFDEDEVSIAIPLSIWECIRKFSSADYSWANKTDEEILAHVTSQVELRTTGEPRKGIMALSGAFVYGLHDDPKEDQISKGVSYFAHIRARQQDLLRSIVKIAEINKGRM